MVSFYILEGQNQYYYAGITKQLSERLGQHNRGESKSTKANKPYIIIYTEEFTDYKKAREKEKRVKNAGVKRWFEKNIKFM
jgi:putative endonuclease